jgi:hypothetical protein
MRCQAQLARRGGLADSNDLAAAPGERGDELVDIRRLGAGARLDRSFEQGQRLSRVP